MKDRILVGIATKQRPEYLSSLLATLMYQTTQAWDLMIVDTDPRDRPFTIGEIEPSNVFTNPQVGRFLNCLEALGHKVYLIHQPTRQKSEVSAINRILVEADTLGYGYLFKCDDDHTMPPDTLQKLRGFLDGERSVKPYPERPAIVSGVSPWMEPAWEGACGPNSVLPRAVPNTECPADMWVEKRDDETILHMNNGHFYRWKFVSEHRSVVLNKRVHPANFMMKPDSRILWTELGSSSMYADAVWSIQLHKLLGYEIYMDLTVNFWHVAAPKGGVREEVGNHSKDTPADNLRKKWLIKLLTDYGMAEKGVTLPYNSDEENDGQRDF